MGEFLLGLVLIVCSTAMAIKSIRVSKTGRPRWD
jgi:hypothetical protein